MRSKYKKIFMYLSTCIMGVCMVVMPEQFIMEQTSTSAPTSGNKITNAISNKPNSSDTASAFSSILDLFVEQKLSNTLAQKPNASITDNPTPTLTPEPIDPTALTLCTDRKINDLIVNYYNAQLTRNEDVIKQSVTDPSVVDINIMYRKTEYITSYHDICCYTKPGIKDGDYVVYITYFLQIENIETYAPAFDELYITTVNGKPLILFGEQPEEITALRESYQNSEDVIALYKDVDEKFQLATKSDEQLYQLYLNLTGQTEKIDDDH